MITQVVYKKQTGTYGIELHTIYIVWKHIKLYRNLHSYVYHDIASFVAVISVYILT